MLGAWAPLAAAEYRAGFAKVDITPTQPIFLSGYAARKKPHEGVRSPIYVKAAALADGKGNRIVFVSFDLVGVPRAVSDEIALEAGKRHGLRRSELVLNASHTHAAPVVYGNLMSMFPLTDEQREAIRLYTRRLVQEVGKTIDLALAGMEPVELFSGHGQGSFAANRRILTAKGVSSGVNRQGPVDQDVPVLAMRGKDGRWRGVLFGYACHNTTIGGDLFQVSGDYAAAAQATLEQQYPGATALFLMLHGADANPAPRGSYELAEQHGKTLATEVARVMGEPMTPVRGKIRTRFQQIDLPFAPHTREQFVEESQSSNWYKQQRATAMLAAYDRRSAPTLLPYPIQLIEFGKSLTVVAMGGEVVVDYVLRLKREYPKRNLIAMGYSNDVACYIPSKRILAEGGYEAVDSMIYYGQPGPLLPETEDRIFAALNKLLGK